MWSCHWGVTLWWASCLPDAALIHFNHMTHRRCEMKTLTKPSNNNSIGTANTITLSAHRNTIWAKAGFRVLPPRCRWLAATTRSFRNVLPWFNKNAQFPSVRKKTKASNYKRGVATSLIYKFLCGDSRKPREAEQRTYQHS